MVTQTVAFPDDHQGAGNLDLVRQSSHAIAERLQPRAKLRTCTLPSEHPDNELNDSQRIVRICAAVIEAGAPLQSAVEALELLREQLEQLDKENLALRDEVDRVSMFEEIVGASHSLQTVLSNIVKVAPTDASHERRCSRVPGETVRRSGLTQQSSSALDNVSNRQASRESVQLCCGGLL